MQIEGCGQSRQSCDGPDTVPGPGLAPGWEPDTRCRLFTPPARGERAMRGVMKSWQSRHRCLARA
jgi:hypothetical protein